MPVILESSYVLQSVKNALQEDIGTGDLNAALIPAAQPAHATIITRESGVLCGVDFAQTAFTVLDTSVVIQWHKHDGDFLNPGETLCTITGFARALLSAERTALNFLQLLSGTATLTQAYVQKISHTNAKLLDTRKTIPGLRAAQKYAVTCGGGFNHRMGLFDAFLLKENHLLAAGSLIQAVISAKRIAPHIVLEVEVENHDELALALDAGVTRILLDNFSLADLKAAVKFTAQRALLEASGNISLDNIADVAQTGVDYISVGNITKQVMPLDLSMRFVTTAYPPSP